MKTLGISYDFHDSSATLSIDGKVVTSILEERLSRQKHDASFPRLSIQHCLKEAQITLNEIDEVVFYEKPELKFSRILLSLLKSFPHSRQEFVDSMQTWLGRKLWTEALIAKELNIDPKRVRTISHHLSHIHQALSALPPGRDSTAVLVIDAVGENATTTLARFDHGKVTILEQNGYPHSLGLFYSAFTRFLGFEPMSDECSTMALAAFGKPTYLSLIQKVISVSDEGRIELNPRLLNVEQFSESPFTPEFLKLFGSPRSPHEDPRNEHWVNLAASVQAAFEAAVIILAKRLAKITGLKTLCYAGGAALNCVANTKILNSSGFDELYIPLDPGDGGASIGAAASRQNGDFHPPRLRVDLGGGAPTLAELDRTEAFVKTFNEQTSSPWSIARYDRHQEALPKIANLLAQNKVLGLVDGGLELGPRALGHRSILFRPDDLALAERVSTKIKRRAPYRPYALAFTPETAHSVLDVQDLQPHRFMQTAVGVRPEFFEKIKGGLHVDLTTRPQIVNSGLLFNILQEWKKTFGIGALINTSFNLRGEPMVANTSQALLSFAQSQLDALIVAADQALMILTKKGTK